MLKKLSILVLAVVSIVGHSRALTYDGLVAQRSKNACCWTFKGPGGPNDVGNSDATVFDAAVEYQSASGTQPSVVEISVEIPAFTTPAVAADLVEIAFENAGVDAADVESKDGTVVLKKGISAMGGERTGKKGLDIYPGKIKVEGDVGTLNKKKKGWVKDKNGNAPVDANLVPVLTIQASGFDANEIWRTDEIVLTLTTGQTEVQVANAIVSAMTSAGWSATITTGAQFEVTATSVSLDVRSLDFFVQGDMDMFVMGEI